MRIYNLEKIIKDMEVNKLSYREAAKKYKITKTRLHNQVKKEQEKKTPKRP